MHTWYLHTNSVRYFVKIQSKYRNRQYLCVSESKLIPNTCIVDIREHRVEIIERNLFAMLFVTLNTMSQMHS